MALDFTLDRRPKTGRSSPKKAASAKKPAAQSPNTPAGMASPIGHPFSMMTTLSSVPRPTQSWTPIRTDLRLPRMSRKASVRPRINVATGSKISGKWNIIALGQGCEQKTVAYDSQQNPFRAMPPSCRLKESSIRREQSRRKRHQSVRNLSADLPEIPFYRIFRSDLRSAHISIRAVTQALKLHPNRQADMS